MFNMKIFVYIVNLLNTLSLYIGISDSKGCEDKLPACHHYGLESCGGPFEAWARHNCPNYCHYCTGPTTPAPSCVDVADDCDSYRPSSCTDPKYSTWAHEKCRYFCKLCPPVVLKQADLLTTTLSPENCIDKLDCKLYDKSTCGGNYLLWAKTNCVAYCGFCKPPPTPHQPCHDLVPNCDQYVSEICSDNIFLSWTKEHCRKFCKMC